MKKLLLLSLAAAAVSAQSQIIYNNGGPNQQNGNEMSNWLQAEDFVLQDRATLDDIHFWTIESPGTFYDGTVQWWVFNDNGGTPGGVFATGIANPTKTFIQPGILGFFDEYKYDIFINGGPLLGAGVRYWLGLHVNTTGNYQVRNDIYWETTNANGTLAGTESFGGTMNNWSSNGQEHAFYLTTVPEPATLVVLGVGLAAFARRRRK